MSKERDPAKLGWLVNRLCKWFTYKELGWKEIDEVFFRWTLWETRWFKVVLHRLEAENWHTKCHDHPWDFLAIILWGGYWEELDPKQRRRNVGRYCYGNTWWRRAGSILYRPAETKHNVVTRRGIPNWSIVIMTNKRRPWGLVSCVQE